MDRGLLLRFLPLLWVLGLYLLLARFIHPFADDWSYAVAGMRTELLPRLWDEYNLWNGRYFSNILVLRGPLVLGLEQGLWLYRSVPVVLILLIWAGAYSLIRAVTVGVLDRWSSVLGSLLFVLVFLNVMPDLSEGIYWYTGAVTYQLPNALSLFLLASWTILLRTPAPKFKGALISMNVLLVIVIAGSNELHMVFMVVLHAVLLLLQYRAHGRVHRALGLILLLSLACAAIVYLAPGNAGRSGQFPHKHELFRSLMWGGIQTGRFLITWIFSPALLITSLLYLPVSRWLVERTPLFSNGFGLRPWMALAIVVVPVFIAMALPYWTTGLLGQHRTVNATLFCFLPAWFMALTVWDKHILQKRFQQAADIRRNSRWFLLALLISLFFAGNGGRLFSDVWDHRWARYDEQLQVRYRSIESARIEGADELRLPNVIDLPRSLHILQATPDPTHWINRSMAYYFGADTLDIVVSDR